jgi:broad specificity phosphatase PhoE
LRRIFLARHGNRQDFVDPSWVSRAVEPYDPPLSADGVEQARRLGERLTDEGIDAIVASPFLRTVQTARHVNEALDVPIFVEPGFGEWLSADSFERSPRVASFEALREWCPKLLPYSIASAALAWPETREQMHARVRRTLGELLSRLDGKLLIVSHAAAVTAAVLLDPRIARVDCPPCALFALEHDGGEWRLLSSGLSYPEGASRPP